jgi:hypothetical protein
VEKLPTKCTITFISLFYAASLLRVSALLGHPQGDSQVVHYITAVGGCPIVAGFLVVHSCNLYMCVCSWLLGNFSIVCKCIL